MDSTFSSAKDVVETPTGANSLISSSSPLSKPGPDAGGKPTTLTLYTPSQILDSPLLPSLFKLLNECFVERTWRDDATPTWSDVELSSRDWQKRRRYMIALRNLMETWSHPGPHPLGKHGLAAPLADFLGTDPDMVENEDTRFWERTLSKYFIWIFFEEFGRPPVVPRRRY